MARVKTTSWKSFEKWHEEEVINEFGLKRYFGYQVLDDFLSELPTLTSQEESKLEELHATLTLFVAAWREEDLKMEFIAGILSIIKFQHPQRVYRTFYDYPVKAILKNEPISGRVDCMLAKGFQIAAKPIFFLQEYKPQTQPSGDPLGQLLIAMLASQYINSDTESPLYGFYIIGGNWFFLVMEGSNFAISRQFNSADLNDLKIILAILKKIKHAYEVKLNLI